MSFLCPLPTPGSHEEEEPGLCQGQWMGSHAHWGPSLLICEGATGVSHTVVERTQRREECQEEGWHPLPKHPLSHRPPLSAQMPFPPGKCSERRCALKFSRTWTYWVAAGGATANNHLIFLLLVMGDIQQDHWPLI